MTATTVTPEISELRSTSIQFVYLMFFFLLLLITLTIGFSTYFCIQDDGEIFLKFCSNYVFILFNFADNTIATSVLQALPLCLVAIDRIMLEKKAASWYSFLIFSMHIASLVTVLYVTQYTKHNINDLIQRIPNGFTTAPQFIDVLNFITRQNFTNFTFLVGLKITNSQKVCSDG